MVEKAYGKINLSLDCKSKREDGYHDLESVMIPIEFHDTLEIYLLPNSVKDDYVVCDDFSLKISKYNLVHKMVDASREKWGFKEHFNIIIHKNLYLQAGLGGGSADAAATLRGIIKYLKINASKEDIKELCYKIGSDVYFQYYNETGLVKGRGNLVETFSHSFPYKILLVKPLSGSSTTEVFNKSDELTLIHGDSNKVKEAFINNDLVALGESTFNSLFEPATLLQKNIKDTYEEVKSYGFEVVGMSGSGSTIYAISANTKLLKKAEKELYLKGYTTDLTKVLNSK